MPDSALDEADRADALARPEKYQRAWLASELDRYRDLFARHERDGPRVYALDPPRPSPRGELSSRALDAHLQWARRGRVGDGRLEIANVDGAGVKLGAQDMSGALLKDVILNRADVSFSIFDRAELTRVRMVEADLKVARSSARGSCGATSGRHSRAGQVRRRGDRRRAIRSRLPRPLPVAASPCPGREFCDADFANSALDEAVFIDCDLRGANLALRKDLLGTTTLTRFERCDLRDTRWEGRDIDGAVFIDCRFHGASGRPARIAGVRIEWPDISPDGDGSVIGRDDDVLSLWRTSRLADLLVIPWDWPGRF